MSSNANESRYPFDMSGSMQQEKHWDDSVFKPDASDEEKIAAFANAVATILAAHTGPNVVTVAGDLDTPLPKGEVLTISLEDER